MMHRPWSSIVEVPHCFSRSNVKFQGHTALKIVKFYRNWFEFTDGYEMLHKAWNSKGEVPYCFPKSSIKFQGHTGQNITAFDPNLAFPDYRPVAAFKSLRFALLYAKLTHLLRQWSCWFKKLLGLMDSCAWKSQLSYRRSVNINSQIYIIFSVDIYIDFNVENYILYLSWVNSNSLISYSQRLFTACSARYYTLVLDCRG